MTNKIPDFVRTPNIYLDGNYESYIVLDFETTWNKYDPSAVDKTNEVVLACWSIVDKDGNVTKKHAFANSMYQHELVADCQKATFIVAHNSKFEAGYLQMCGIDLRTILIYCTMLGEWVRYGNLTVDKSLSTTAARYGLGTKEDFVSKLIKNGVCSSTIPDNWLLTYCEQDVNLTHQIFLQQRDILANNNKLHLAHTRNLTAVCLADIEMAGMYLDPERVQAEYKGTLRRRNWLRRELSLLTNNINLNSPQQVGTYVYEILKFKELFDRKGVLKTPTGNYLTDSGSLQKLVATTEAQKEFVKFFAEYNRCDSLLTKNLDFFQRICVERGGTFYAKLRQGVTATHRLASAGIPTLFKGEKTTKSVQFQNLPRVYKNLFTAEDKDYVIGECDGAQLEFRTGTAVGDDPVGLQEIVDNVDVHSFTAKVLTDAGEPTTRQAAKASTFAPLFGGMGKTPAQQAYAKAFKAKYAGITATQEAWCWEVAATKQLTLPWGMQFFFPEASMNKYGRLNVLTNVSNYPIQSLATGEIIPIALVYFWYRSAGSSIIILNTIHDSIVVLMHKNDVQLFEELSKQCLTTDVFDHLRVAYNYEFKVPLGVGIKVAKHWGDTKQEIKYSVFPDETYTRTVD